jgi:hypothetical protein
VQVDAAAVNSSFPFKKRKQEEKEDNTRQPSKSKLQKVSRKTIKSN